MSRLRDLPPNRLDALIALVLGLFAACEVALSATGADDAVPALVGLGGMCLGIAFRRRAPLFAVLVIFVFGIPMSGLVDLAEDFTTPFFILLVMGYSLGSLPELRTALVGLGLMCAGVAGVSTAMGDASFGDYVFPMGFMTAAWGGGRTIRHRAHLTAELHEAAERAEEEREARAARAAADERRRIAREMHDVVAHSVSVMVVQAGGARRILERDPERAAEAARLIESTGRGALLEMRRLLGVLATAEEPVAMAPQPTLDEIGPLVTRAREAGLPVELHVEGERRALPAGAEAAVFRVVQEALTNALKHARSAPTEVLLRWSPDALEVVVADRGGSATAAPSLPSGGHGIVGMRERVRIYGGSLSALPRPDGGFVVRARLPLDGSELVVA